MWENVKRNLCSRLWQNTKSVLGRYVKMQIIEVPDEKTPDGASEKLEMQIKEKEGRRLLDKIRPDDEVIALAIEGEQKTSEQFAVQIDQYGITGKGNIVFDDRRIARTFGRSITEGRPET